MSAFDIEEGREPLVVQVMDVQPNRDRDVIGTVNIDLRDLSE